VTATRHTVAVVGLGAMGQRIAGRLLDAGHELRVWNRTATKADTLIERGASLAVTPAVAAAAADAVITMVADPAALRAVSEGADGIAAVVRPQTVVIQMSTVGPAALERLATALGPETPLLDAPVLGSVAEAEAGTLTIFVGGDGAVVDDWSPLLSAVGRPLHVGDVGAGSAAKLVANSALFAVVAALGEALALADALGIDREVAYDVLAATPLAAQAERRRRSIEDNSYPPRFKLALARKDAALIVETAQAADADIRLAAAVRTWLIDAEIAGRGADDYAAIVAEIISRARGAAGASR